jgi:hypothetical protein
MFRVRMGYSIAAIVLSLGFGIGSAKSQPAPASDDYSVRIEPIFTSRCIGCHSCYNAPCQLNLQSYSGLARGATKLNVYDRSRLESVAPSRLDIDGHSVSDWRAKGFFDVLGDASPARTLLIQLLALRAGHPAVQPRRPVDQSNFCPADGDQAALISRSTPELGMPYGLPPLSTAEIATVSDWIANGAPGPTEAILANRRMVSPEVQTQMQAWQAFLNGSSPREKLVARYLFEHLFLAHLYFSSEAASRRPAFFRLVRSRTPCETGIDEIATRRPNDDPGPADFHYCLSRLEGAIVGKTHIPYELTPSKLERIRSLFIEPKWDVNGLPGYDENTASNPFVTFADIPVRSRYQFLLDDAEYEVSTFIKGPVCNGSIAVNSIQAQFFVFFLKPDADSMVMSAEFAQQAQDLLVLPGEWGSDIPLIDDIPFLHRLIEHREAYRKLRAENIRKLRPAGYTLDDIWNGDGHNPNALLTIFRHFDTAVVTQGAVGDLSKTLFVLDYPLLERLVYNLVVNYDVFGNVGHQSLTRLYMDLIRMEAEELFLAFLPPSERTSLRNSWYQGGPFTELKLRYVFPLENDSTPTGVVYRNAADAKAEFVEQLLNERLPPQVRGRPDLLNWKTLQLFPAPGQAPETASELAAPEQALRRVASIKAADSTPFARFLPDLALVLIDDKEGGASIYSVVHNREHANVSWILGESERLAPQEDSLTVRAGVLGAYPNMFFVVPEDKIDLFTSAISSLKSAADYERLVDSFGVRRSNGQFWSFSDRFNSIHLVSDPVRSGAFDLTRYELDTR